MVKNLSVSENRQVLKYYNIVVPNTIHRIKKKAAVTIFRHMCKSNVDINDNHKHFLSILHRKKMISPNNKNRHMNTSKIHKPKNWRRQTRVCLQYHL